jgi:hypothetical protein
LFSTIAIVIGFAMCGSLLMLPFGLLLNLVGLPGALLAFSSERLAEMRMARFIPGLIVTTAAQMAVYLSYVALIVKSVHASISGDTVFPWLIWMAAFFAAVHPINVCRTMGFREDDENRREARAKGEPELAINPSVWGASLTFFASLIAFFVFAFRPSTTDTLWGWVPGFDFG